MLYNMGSQSISDRCFSPKPLENHHHGRGGIEFTVCLVNERPCRSNNTSSSNRRLSRHYELSFSDGKDSPCSSIFLNKERCPHHPRASSKLEMKRGRSSGDELGRSRSQPDIRDLKRKRMELDHSQHSEKLPRSSDRGIRRHGVKVELDKNCSRSSRDSKDRQASRHEEKNMRDGWARERWKMTSRSNEDSPGRHHHNKSRKKTGTEVPCLR